jgi:hypothetical protein
MSSSRHDLQIIKKKIETGEHYFTKEELDARDFVSMKAFKMALTKTLKNIRTN